jgi:hypothetical protein
MALLGQWQALVPVLVVVAVIVWVLKRFGVEKPKIASLIANILEASQGWLSSVLGDKYGAVYNALMPAIEAVADGKFTEEEALATARNIFASALKVASVTLTADEQATVDKILVLLVDTIMHDQPAAKVSIKAMVK